jgi:outer membrane protein assembly factor BamB
VADSERVWFYFGSYGLYCLDHDGKEIWRKNLGTMHSKHGHGEGSSPVLSGDILALNWDHEGPSFTIALNKRNGERIWQRDRDEETSWSSPIVVSHDGRKQLIVSGTKRIRAYDLETGDVIWQCGGMSSNIVASPVAGDGMVFLGSSYETRQMLGIKLAGAKGDITSSENVVWSRTSRTPYVPSPLLVSGQLYFLRHYQGILTRLVAETGEEPTGPFRLGQMEEIYSSPVSAAGRIYVTDRRGNTAVFTTGPQPEFLAVNRLTDRFSASAAIAGRQLFLRGERFLYCLQAARKNEPSE